METHTPVSDDGVQPDEDTGTVMPSGSQVEGPRGYRAQIPTPINSKGQPSARRRARAQAQQPKEEPKPDKSDTRPTRVLFLHEPGRWPPGGWERDMIQVVCQQFGCANRGRVKDADPGYGRAYQVQGAAQQLDRLEKRYHSLYDQVYEQSRVQYRTDGKDTEGKADPNFPNWAPYINAYGAGLVQGYAQVHDISHAPQRPARNQPLYDRGVRDGKKLFAPPQPKEQKEQHVPERERELVPA